jgi:hypothetical protein
LIRVNKVITTGLGLEVVMGRRRVKKSNATDARGAEEIVTT